MDAGIAGDGGIARTNCRLDFAACYADFVLIRSCRGTSGLTSCLSICTVCRRIIARWIRS
jgi:hypothetical protein